MQTCLRALFNLKTSFSIQKRHPYTGNFNSETSGDSKDAFLRVESLAFVRARSKGLHAISPSHHSKRPAGMFVQRSNNAISSCDHNIESSVTLNIHVLLWQRE